MACPFFEPTGRLDRGNWATPPRQPLGSACAGLCRAAAEPVEPAPDILEEFCNRGYARFGCSRFPAGADDALRFSVDPPVDAGPLSIRFIYERNYAPSRHGRIEYPAVGPLNEPAAIAQLKMFTESYLRRRAGS